MSGCAQRKEGRRGAPRRALAQPGVGGGRQREANGTGWLGLRYQETGRLSHQVFSPHSSRGWRSELWFMLRVLLLACSHLSPCPPGTFPLCTRRGLETSRSPLRKLVRSGGGHAFTSLNFNPPQGPRLLTRPQIWVGLQAMKFEGGSLQSIVLGWGWGQVGRGWGAALAQNLVGGGPLHWELSRGRALPSSRSTRSLTVPEEHLLSTFCMCGE